MTKKTKTNIGFEKQLWNAARVLWGHIPAAEYRKVIVGLIFLRYVSAAFERRYAELVEEGEGFEDDKDFYRMKNVFFTAINQNLPRRRGGRTALPRGNEISAPVGRFAYTNRKRRNRYTELAA